MQESTNLIGPKLVCKSSGHRKYEIRSDSGLFGHLSWQNTMGSSAVGQTAKEEWSFKRMGFFKPIITIRKIGQSSNLGVIQFEPWGRAKIKIANGHEYSWSSITGKRGQKGIFDRFGGLLISLKPKSTLKGFQCEIDIGKQPASTSELSLLVLVVVYRLILEYEENNAALMAGIMAAIGA